MKNKHSITSKRRDLKGVTMTILFRRFLGWALFLTITIARAGGQNRPAITGISHMCIYSSNAGATENFYAHDIGATKDADPQDPTGTRYYLSPTQFVEVLSLPAKHTISRMACVAYNTVDVSVLRQYLRAHGVDEVGELLTGSDGTRWFKTKDPEGNEVQFIQPGKPPLISANARPIGTRMVHVGYLVHSKDAENHFYKDILGFRLYWYGGGHPGLVDWYQLQVPEGRDYVEYGLVGDGSSTPLSKIDQEGLGSMNHMSIGVPNMEVAVTTLLREERFSPRHYGPLMGLDGKWEAALWDPDGVRIELIEFQPVLKPCCYDFLIPGPVN
jgi:catechol 2,3-dioxygenase-like lactoylglutathione lyase family enzyme